jgi:molybdopterin-guanine dinucleotide biosynthesis protein A
MRNPLGVVLAGGASSRYGSPKALALVGGVRVVDRVIAALRETVSTVVCSANDATLAAAIGLRSRPDVLTGVGPLGGLHAMLLWARARRYDGILAVGSDMPFLEPALLRALLERAIDVDAVLPWSDGPRGVEPLCAWYGDACVAAIEAAVARGDRRVIGFHDAVRVATLSREEVRALGDPVRMFMNLNTPADRDTAERELASEQ